MAVSALGATLQALRAATLADIAAYIGALPGYIARIDSVGRSYIAVTTGTSTADGISYLTGTGVDWQMIYGSSDPKWLTQATWFIDSSAGSDEATGIDAAHPVKTADEIQRRWGIDPNIPQSVTITLLPGTHDHVYLHATPLNSTCQLTVMSVPTAVVTTTIGTFTGFTHGTYGSVNPERTIITAASGIADWTAYVAFGYRLKANGTLYSNPALLNPAGGGVNTVATQPFGSMAATGSMLYTQTNPAGGQALVLELLPTIHNVKIIYEGGALATTVALIVRDLAVDQSFIVRRGNARCRVFGCSFSSTCSTPELSPNPGSLQRFMASSFYTNYEIQYDYYGCLFVGIPFIGSSPNCGTLISSCLLQGGSNANGMNAPVALGLSNTQIFGNTAAAGVITCGEGGVLTLSSGISGINTGPGVILRDAGSINTSGTINLISSSGSATIGDVVVGGQSTTTGVGGFKWSDVPATGLEPGYWYGTDTLASGVRTITLAPALTALFPSGSIIEMGYIVPAAGAGVLGYDTVTTGGFRITSSNLTDSTSTVWWRARCLAPRTSKVIPSTLV